MTFPAQSPDLRRFPLVAGASRSVVRSPRSAAPRIRFLFVDSRVRFTLRSAYASRRTPCASLRSLRPGSGRTFTSKSSPMPGPHRDRGGPAIPVPSPPTPPGMRVRTWRFGELRSVRREPGHTQLVEVRPWQGRVQGVVRGHVPPASREPSSSPGEVLAHTASPQLPVRCPSPFPLA